MERIFVIEIKIIPNIVLEQHQKKKKKEKYC